MNMNIHIQIRHRIKKTKCLSFLVFFFNLLQESITFQILTNWFLIPTKKELSMKGCIYDILLYLFKLEAMVHEIYYLYIYIRCK